MDHHLHLIFLHSSIDQNFSTDFWASPTNRFYLSLAKIGGKKSYYIGSTLNSSSMVENPIVSFLSIFEWTGGKRYALLGVHIHILTYLDWSGGDGVCEKGDSGSRTSTDVLDEEAVEAGKRFIVSGGSHDLCNFLKLSRSMSRQDIFISALKYGNLTRKKAF